MLKITIQELDEMLQKLRLPIREVIKKTEFEDCDDLSALKDFEKIINPDEIQLVDEYKTVMCQLCDIYYTLLYQHREIIGEGVLSFNSQGYYEDKYHEYHCGDGIEYYFYDDWDEKYKWRTSRIEHNGNRYYIVGNPNIELNGLRVRHRKR